jgi:hypothetical protein
LVCVPVVVSFKLSKFPSTLGQMLSTPFKSSGSHLATYVYATRWTSTALALIMGSSVSICKLNCRSLILNTIGGFTGLLLNITSIGLVENLTRNFSKEFIHSFDLPLRSIQKKRLHNLLPELVHFPCSPHIPRPSQTLYNQYSFGVIFGMLIN